MTVRNLAIFTVCSNNYLPMAKVLVETAHVQFPNSTIYICLADKRLPHTDFYPPGCLIIPAEDLDIPQFSQFAFRYDVMEFNTALKPYMLLHLLRHDHDAVLYFDPDIELFAPLGAIMRALDEGASFVLTPHLLLPAEGDDFPDDIGIMRAGVYNLGFLGVGATPETGAILEWWARRLRYQCVSEQSRGIFVDQKFMDLVPGFADHVYILRDSRYNVAYWNLGQRQLLCNGSGWQVDGEPLAFFHFSGFDPTNLTRLSKYTAAFRDDAISAAVKAIMKHYADRVLANGFRASRSIPYAYGQFASGAPVPVHIRRLFREQHQDFPGDPFVTFEADAALSNPNLPPQTSVEELTAQLLAVYNSSSWRLTRPLRAAKRLLQR